MPPPRPAEAWSSPALGLTHLLGQLQASLPNLPLPTLSCGHGCVTAMQYEKPQDSALLCPCPAAGTLSPLWGQEHSFLHTLTSTSASRCGHRCPAGPGAPEHSSQGPSAAASSPRTQALLGQERPLPWLPCGGRAGGSWARVARSTDAAPRMALAAHGTRPSRPVQLPCHFLAERSLALGHRKTLPETSDLGLGLHVLSVSVSPLKVTGEGGRGICSRGPTMQGTESWFPWDSCPLLFVGLWRVLPAGRCSLLGALCPQVVPMASPVQAALCSRRASQSWYRGPRGTPTPELPGLAVGPTGQLVPLPLPGGRGSSVLRRSGPGGVPVPCRAAVVVGQRQGRQGTPQ